MYLFFNNLQKSSIVLLKKTKTKKKIAQYKIIIKHSIKTNLKNENFLHRIRRRRKKILTEAKVIYLQCLTFGDIFVKIF